MTREICDIITAYREAQKAGLQTALATVVHVEGSSYRRPGARMLVDEHGNITGAISGGCLEGDALRKALFAIFQKQNKLVTYNTLDDDDDVNFGVQLGCNGIVHILFEPIDPDEVNNPIALLENCVLHRVNAVLVTLFSIKNYHGHQPGTCFFFNEEKICCKPEEKELADKLKKDASLAIASASSMIKPYEENELTAFIELLKPPVSLIIVGAGNDALPLVEMAMILGWQITLVDGRPSHANFLRFPKAYQIIVGKPEEVKKNLVIDERSAVVLMTHNYNYDREMLELLLREKCRYIGALGPKKRIERMVAELEAKGLEITDIQKNMIYGPIGLDIGAEAAEEIALSMLAEIKAVFAERSGAFLRSRLDTIHSHATFIETKTDTL